MESQQLELKDSPENQNKLDELLAGCFVLQKMYGRAPDSMEIVVTLFHNILGKYPADRVVKAFEVWLEKSPEFPTPADIINIVSPSPSPPWKPDWTYYNHLKERRSKGDLGKYTPEFTYLEKCEEWAQRNAKEGEL